MGVMPPHEQLGGDTIKDLANYVRSLSGLPNVRPCRQGQGNLWFGRLLAVTEWTPRVHAIGAPT
jgi:cytochrome c oxidase cbb3-type subunit 3